MVLKKYLYIKRKVIGMNLNKNGFAVSTMLYGLIFTTIAVFYLVISIVSARYTTNTDFTNDVRIQLKNL